MRDYKQFLDDLVKEVVAEGASDLHLSEKRNPVLRVSGLLIPLLKIEPLTKEDMTGLIDCMTTPEYKQRFLQTKEVDFSYAHGDVGRFRGNCFFRQGMISIALRLVPKKIKTLTELNLPPILESFTRAKQGFFLVVGPVGQGKSTTLASMIDIINDTRMEHILTVEDPIEYEYEPKKSIIDQREVNIDTDDFHTALVSMFREDINVVLIGEMRGLETISTAVTAAETGHLVFSTLHTNNAPQTVERIIDSFPADQQSQIRMQLAGSLSGIFSQRLVPRVSGGLIPAYELLINNSAVANLIRENRTHELATVIETGSQLGMIDMNRSLADLVRAGEISMESAYRYSFNPKVLERLL